MRMYKEALTPSRFVARRVINSVIMKKEQSMIGRSVLNSIGYYIKYMSKTLKLLVPVAGLAVLLFFLMGNKNTQSPVSTAADTDQIVNAMVSNELSEQDIVDEADSDTAFVNTDNVTLDALASVYIASEY